MPDPNTWRAYAKVNLCLSVGAPVAEGPKAGFHPIASWMQAIDLYDEVTVQRLPAGHDSCFSVRWAEDAPCPSPIDWPAEKDLAVRAHRAVEALHRLRGGPDVPARIQIVKRVPVGGGLGGGSSDGAAVLQGLLAGQQGLSESAIRSMAAELGSDVAFFADEGGAGGVPRAALVTGFGDRIRRVQSVPGELVLVIPPYGCATGPVYKAYDELLRERASLDAAERAARGITGREKETGPKESLVEARWARMAKAGKVEGDHLFNDLARAAFRVEARLGKLVTALSNTTRRQAHVTGSGSCVFIPCDEGRIERVMTQVQKLLGSSEEFSGVKAIRTRLL